MIDEEVAIVMCYTHWKHSMSKDAVAHCRAVLPGWNAKRLKQYLSVQETEVLNQLMTLGVNNANRQDDNI